MTTEVSQIGISPSQIVTFAESARPRNDRDILRERVFSALLEMEHSPVDEQDLKDADESTPLEDDLELDSLDIVNLQMTLEEDFGIEIPDEISLKWETIGDVVDYLIQNT